MSARNVFQPGELNQKIATINAQAMYEATAILDRIKRRVDTATTNPSTTPAALNLIAIEVEEAKRVLNHAKLSIANIEELEAAR